MTKLSKRNSASEVYTELVMVTPEMAGTWLSFNKHNRPLRSSTVKLYSQYMKNKEWLLNGESIKFSSENFLLDGQHRLSAVVSSGETVQMIVMHNLDPDTFKTIDTGKKRSGGDSLSVEGYTQSARLASSISCLIKYHKKSLFIGSRELASSNSEIISFVRSNPSIVDDMYDVIGNIKLSKVIPLSVIGGLYPFMKFADQEKADIFVNILANGYDDRQHGNSSAIALRNRLTSERFSDRRPRQSEFANLLATSWNSFYRGKVVTISKKSTATDTLSISGSSRMVVRLNENV